MKRIAVLVFFMVCAIHANGNGGTGWGLVTETYVNSGWTMVKVSGVSENPDECMSTVYYALNPSQPSYTIFHSTLLAAHMAGKQVRFWVSGCGGQNDKYPKIVSVFVK